MRHHQNSSSTRSGDFQLNDMAPLLRRSGIDFSSNQLKQLWIYHTLLRQYNASLNLTRVHNFSSMVLKLYVDSILPGRLIDLPSSLMDLGTGPGMPGIPLKIAYPHLKLILAESRGKRVEFLKMAVERLELKDTAVIGKAITAAFDTPVQAVITRAVEDIRFTLERLRGCLASGGRVIFMKGPGCDAEITEAREKMGTEFKFIRQIEYEIPHSTHDRRLVEFRRIGQPSWERRASAMRHHTLHAIESEQNSIFKKLKALLNSRGIKKQQLALVSGARQVLEVLRDFPEQCRAWIAAPHHLPPPVNAPAQMEWYQLAGPLFKTVDIIGTDAPILMVDMPVIKKWSVADSLPVGCSLLVPFQDPENVGAVIRSAVAFGVNNIILLSESAHPFHPRAIRASGGAILKASLFEGPALNDIPDNLPIIALSQEGKEISGIEFPATFAFLPGIEGQGLPRHLRSRAVSIPMRGGMESLNAAIATAIAIYTWSIRTGETTV